MAVLCTFQDGDGAQSVIKVGEQIRDSLVIFDFDEGDITIESIVEAI